MAKASVSRHWFIAVDGEKDFLRQKWMEYSRQSGVVQLFVVSHSGSTGDNPHVHVLLQEQDAVQKQSLDVRLKKFFEITNAKTQHYSSKVWDGNTSSEGAGSYLFHEVGAEILVNVGVSEEHVVLMRKAHEAVQKVVAVNKQKASGKLVERALDHFRKPEVIHQLRVITPANIAHWMLVEIHEGRNYYSGEFRLKSFVEEVVIKLKPSDELWGIACKFTEKICI